MRHHSAVELVDRATAAGLVRRTSDPQDARIVRVRLTPKGDRLVSALTEAHLAELHHLAAALNELAPGGQRPVVTLTAAELTAGEAARVPGTRMRARSPRGRSGNPDVVVLRGFPPLRLGQVGRPDRGDDAPVPGRPGSTAAGPSPGAGP